MFLTRRSPITGLTGSFSRPTTTCRSIRCCRSTANGGRQLLWRRQPKATLATDFFSGYAGSSANMLFAPVASGGRQSALIWRKYQHAHSRTIASDQRDVFAHFSRLHFLCFDQSLGRYNLLRRGERHTNCARTQTCRSGPSPREVRSRLRHRPSQGPSMQG